MFNKFTSTWFEVYDEDNIKLRRFLSKDEADHFAEPEWTVKKVVIEHKPFIPEDAPF